MSTLAMMHGDGDHMMSGWIGTWIALWAVLALALIVLAVVATVWLVKHLSSSGSGSDDRRILERRYASGDIEREEFLQRVTTWPDVHSQAARERGAGAGLEVERHASCGERADRSLERRLSTTLRRRDGVTSVRRPVGTEAQPRRSEWHCGHGAITWCMCTCTAATRS